MVAAWAAAEWAEGAASTEEIRDIFISRLKPSEGREGKMKVKINSGSVVKLDQQKNGLIALVLEQPSSLQKQRCWKLFPYDIEDLGNM